MGEFSRVEVATEASELVDVAVDKLQEELEAKGVVGWEPNEGDLEIILLNVLAPMAANAATVASTVLEATFRKYGTELAKVAYNEGKAATATTTWTQLPEAGKYPVRTIPAGTQLEGNGFAFTTETEVTTTSEVSTVTVNVVAAERGPEYNGVTTMTLVNNLNYISGVAVVGETTGGTEQETDEAYMNRLAQVLELQAPRPITAGNYAQMVLDATTGVTVGRATAIDGYSPEVIKIEGKTTTVKTDLKEVSTFTGVSLESTSLPQKHPGSELHWEADGAKTYTTLARGTTMKAKLGGSEGELNKAALLTAAKGKIEVVGKYEQERTVTVFVLGPEGKELSSGERTTLKTYLEERRELNFKIYVEPPSYNEVRVTATVHCLPGYTESAVVANVKTAVENYLSPKNWGNPSGAASGAQTWLNATEAFGVVRYNQLVGVIEAVAGVAYVPSGSSGLAIGLEEAPASKVADLILAGPAPLTETIAAHIVVSAV